MNFSEALEYLKKGMKVARQGWNGKGMWLRYYDPYTDKQFPIREIEPCEGTPLPWIGMKTADNKFVPWLASQTDILADDWEVHERTRISDWRNIHLHEMSIRLSNALLIVEKYIEFIEDITDTDLLWKRNFGKKSLQEFKKLRGLES